MAADASQGRQVQIRFQKVPQIQTGPGQPRSGHRLTAFVLVLTQLVGGCHGAGGHNWTLYTVAASWNQAFNWCQGLNQTLLVLDSQAQQTAFVSLWDESPVITTNDVWMGVHLASPGQPDIVSATTPCRNISYANWSAGEPNLLDTDFCIRLAHADKTWKTFTCFTLYPFACDSETDSCWFEVFEDYEFGSLFSQLGLTTMQVAATSRESCQDQCLAYSSDASVCTAARYMDTQGCQLLLGQNLFIKASERPEMTSASGSAVFVQRCYMMTAGTLQTSQLTGEHGFNSSCFGAEVAESNASTSSLSALSTTSSTSASSSIAASSSTTALMPSSNSEAAGLTSSGLMSSTAMALSSEILGESVVLTLSSDTSSWSLATASSASLMGTATFTSADESNAALSASSEVEASSFSTTSAPISAFTPFSSTRSPDATDLTSGASVATSDLSVAAPETASSLVLSGLPASSAVMPSFQSAESGLLSSSWNDVAFESLPTTSERTPGTTLTPEMTSDVDAGSNATGFLVASTVQETLSTTSALSTEVVIDPKPLCFCRCQFSVIMVTAEEAAYRHRNLLLNKSLLSATRRKLTSAPDHRVSAAVIGRSGVAIMVTVGVLLVLPDVVKAAVFLKSLVRVRARN